MSKLDTSAETIKKAADVAEWYAKRRCLKSFGSLINGVNSLQNIASIWDCCPRLLKEEIIRRGYNV